MALVGGGMFGGDVVLRSIEDVVRCGLAPYLGRVGLDHRARLLAPIQFSLDAIGTRTPETAERLARSHAERVPGSAPRAYSGERPWEEILARHQIDVLVIATPDHLHHAPAVAALSRGTHILVEKPLALRLREADEILRLAEEQGLVAGVDMHKRYDPCHRYLFESLVPRIGKPLYARAVLEEPLEVSTTVFRWAAQSNPFSYVGVHWTDLFGHYLGLEPASLHAVGQKELLARRDRPIDTFDAMQVSVEYTSGLRVYYVNSWVQPKEFEGPVNQEMEITGTLGKIEFDQQYRGLRATITGEGSRTYNPHFTADVPRIVAGGGGTSLSPAYDGYGKDSIVVVLERAAEAILGHATREEMRGTYQDIESSRPTVAILEAAAEVARRNLEHLRAGRGAPVTARFTGGGFEVVEPA